MDNIDLSEKLQSRFSDIIEKEGKKLLQWAAVLLVAVAAFLYFFYFKEDKKNPHQALDATYFALTEATPQEIQQELPSFIQALQHNPDLSPLYQGKAAQLLIEKGASTEAVSLLNPLFKRVELSRYPSYQSFAGITIQISEGEYQEALNQSLSLQTTLENEPTLFAHNLIRIALLQKMLSLPEYKESFSLIKSHAQNGPYKEAFSKAIDSYTYKNLGLISFFET